VIIPEIRSLTTEKENDLFNSINSMILLANQNSVKSIQEKLLVSQLPIAYRWEAIS